MAEDDAGKLKLEKDADRIKHRRAIMSREQAERKGEIFRKSYLRVNGTFTGVRENASLMLIRSCPLDRV